MTENELWLWFRIVFVFQAALLLLVMLVNVRLNCLAEKLRQQIWQIRLDQSAYGRYISSQRQH